MKYYLCSGKSLMLLGAAALMFVMVSVVDSTALGRRQLHCSAGKILDENNAAVILRGFGLGNWLMPEGYMWGTTASHDAPREFEAGVLDVLGGDTVAANEFWRLYFENYTTEKDVCAMKVWGCNSVRVSFNAHFLQPRSGQPANPPYIYNEESFKILDNFVSWCAKYQLWVIWDMHGAPGGQSKDNIADSDGEARLWSEPNTYWPRAIDLWKKIAQRYAENDWIVGYNLLNEPLLNRYGFARSDYRTFSARCTDTIRKVDSKGLIFIDGDDYGQNFTDLTPPWDPQVVYSFHCYPPVTWKNPFGLDAIRDQYGTPLWHGETGEQSNFATNTACINNLESYTPAPIGWAWWQLKKFNATRQPFNIVKTTGFQTIITYWNNGGTKPTVANAQTWLYDMARKTNSDSSSVTYIPEMVNSLKLNGNAKCVVCTERPLIPGSSSQFNVRHRLGRDGVPTITFTLPYSSAVNISVFDLNGKLQKALVNETMFAGDQSVVWDRTNGAGNTVSKGVYIYTIAAGDKKVSRQMVLAK
jgi:endoglucanase